MYVAHTPSDLKPDVWHSLTDHLNTVADLCFEYGKNINLPYTAKFLGQIHDLGKYKPEFQNYLRVSHATGLKQSSVPHKQVGALYLLENFGDTGELLALSILGHHNEIPSFRHLESEIDEFTNVDEMERCFSLAVKDGMNFDLTFVQEFQDFIKGKAPDEIFFILRFLHSVLVDSDHIDTSNHFYPYYQYVENKTNIDKMIDDYELFQSEFNCRNEIDVLRTEIKNVIIKNSFVSTNIFTMTATTGAGKTNCGLGFALNHSKHNNLQKIVFVQPFTSITDQTASIYQGIFKNKSTVLEHHSVVNEKDGINEKWRSKASQNWNAPIVISTMVQLLESLFDNKPSKIRKLHRLANACIVLDEAQSIPLNLVKPTLNALSHLNKIFNTTVVLCTATQPDFHKYLKNKTVELIDNYEDYFKKLERNTICYNSNSYSIDTLADELKSHNQTLCIVNKRKIAQHIVKKLQRTENKDEVLHLSTTMTPNHRKKVLENVHYRLKNDLRIILIATSCIECGVDVDFPLGYRQNCYLSSIYQAAGRINRNGNNKDKYSSPLIVFDLENERHDEIMEYGIVKSRDYINFEDISNPNVISKYFKEMFEDHSSRLDYKNIIRSSQKLDYPQVSTDYKIIENNNINLIISNADSQDIIALVRNNQIPPFEINKKLGPYCISVKPNDIKGRESSVDTSIDGLFLWTGAYNEVYGLEL
jgi:CRISPR-associated endonuclease/helicase Cas3